MMTKYYSSGKWMTRFLRCLRNGKQYPSRIYHPMACWSLSYIRVRNDYSLIRVFTFSVVNWKYLHYVKNCICMLVNIVYNYHDSDGGNNERVNMMTVLNTTMMMNFQEKRSQFISRHLNMIMFVNSIVSEKNIKCKYFFG